MTESEDTEAFDKSPDTRAWRYATRFVRKMQLLMYCPPDHPVVVMEEDLIRKSMSELEETAGNDVVSRASLRVKVGQFLDNRISALDLDDDVKADFREKAVRELSFILPVIN